MMQGGSRPTVTTAAPGAKRDADRAVTAAPPIISVPIPVTCTFPSGAIAVVQVYGAASQEEAVSIVERQAFPSCRYTVAAGDPTGGRAEPFYLWACNAEDQQQIQQIDQKRSMEVLRNGV
jgi:hypothetical protein